MIELDGTKLFLVTGVVFLVYIYIKYYVYNYWKRHGVPHEEPSIPFGNITYSFILGKITLGALLKENYEKCGHNRFHGFYVLNRPIISINDPELIREVLVKEFSRFIDRGWFFDEKVDPMSDNLFLQSADKWKRLRSKLTPTFTPNKLRQLYPLMKDVSEEMLETCDAMLKENNEVEIKDLLIRYSTDIISSIVYGFKCHSLKEPNNEFLKLGIKAFEFGRMTLMLAIWYPEILQKITLPVYQKRVREFFKNTFFETIEYRRRNNIVRQDFMNFLLQLVKDGELEDDENQSKSNEEVSENKDKLNMAEAVAQAFMFFMAGFETTSSTATYCLLELAKNPDVQEKLHQVVDEMAASPEGFTFDSILECEYLDMVFSETLRKYPVVSVINRIAKERFPIPDSNYTIPKGMRVIISVSGIYKNPKYFPDPEKFDPSRFTKENFASRPSYVHLGFGEGPRNCIGKRFGLIQTKLALVQLLYNYKFRLSSKTTLPVQVSTESFVLTPVHGIYLFLDKRRR